MGAEGEIALGPGDELVELDAGLLLGEEAAGVTFKCFAHKRTQKIGDDKLRIKYYQPMGLD